MANNQGNGGGANKDQIEVTVSYVAAKHDYEDKHVDPQATLLEVKQAAMKKFKVEEAQTGNEQVFFWLYLGDTKLEDQSRTIGAISAGASSVEFMLVQQIIYGA